VKWKISSEEFRSSVSKSSQDKLSFIGSMSLRTADFKFFESRKNLEGKKLYPKSYQQYRYEFIKTEEDRSPTSTSMYLFLSYYNSKKNGGEHLY